MNITIEITPELIGFVSEERIDINNMVEDLIKMGFPATKQAIAILNAAQNEQAARKAKANANAKNSRDKRPTRCRGDKDAVSHLDKVIAFTNYDNDDISVITNDRYFLHQQRQRQQQPAVPKPENSIRPLCTSGCTGQASLSSATADETRSSAATPPPPPESRPVSSAPPKQILKRKIRKKKAKDSSNAKSSNAPSATKKASSKHVHFQQDQPQRRQTIAEHSSTDISLPSLLGEDSQRKDRRTYMGVIEEERQQAKVISTNTPRRRNKNKLHPQQRKHVKQPPATTTDPAPTKDVLKYCRSTSYKIRMVGITQDQLELLKAAGLDITEVPSVDEQKASLVGDREKWYDGR